jgi:hypothetical protein
MLVKVGSWQPSLFLRRKFEHPDGRKIYAIEDTRAGKWIVEMRYGDSRKLRWYPETEQAAADTVFALTGDESGWEDATTRS